MMKSLFYHKPRFLIRAYKYLYQFDKDEIKYILDNLKPGDIAIDLGAHKGAYMFWMRKSVGNSGKVLCIEPQPLLFNYLIKMVSIFGYSNVRIMDCAISDKDGVGTITIPGKQGNISQCARIDDDRIIQDKQESHQIEVEIKSIDNIVKETGLQPDLIKIDVEGHEFNVIKGMKYTLSEIRPKIIMECEDRHVKNHTVHDVFNLILEYDYHGYFYKGGIKLPLSKFDVQNDQQRYIRSQKRPDENYVANFIFEPDSRR